MKAKCIIQKFCGGPLHFLPSLVWWSVEWQLFKGKLHLLKTQKAKLCQSSKRETDRMQLQTSVVDNLIAYM